MCLESESPEIKCHFCAATVETVEEAIEADWVPSFFDGDDEVSSPVCPACQATHLRVATDGELELIPTESHATTNDEIPLTRDNE